MIPRASRRRLLTALIAAIAAVSCAATARAGADYPGAAWQPASKRNYAPSARPVSTPINTIVVHVTQGSFLSAVHWFQNPRADVSAHFVVRARDGAITQAVATKDIGWHAGNRFVNAASIGIEHEGFVTKCGGFTEPMYRSSARLVAYLAMRYGIPIDRRHIIGHAEVADPAGSVGAGGADGHTDPGRCWRWPHYLSLAKQFAAASPLSQPVTIVDNKDDVAIAAPGWRSAANSKQRLGDSFLTATATAQPATVSAALAAGSYAVYAWWPAAAGRSREVTLAIETASGTVDLTVDQTRDGGRWSYLGTFGFAAGALPRVVVTPGSGGTTAVDGFRFQRVSTANAAQLLDGSSGFALGSSGLQRTRDGGTTWTTVSPPNVPAERLRAARFLDAQRGWLVALGDRASLDLYRTSDGGVTWTSSVVPAPADLDAFGPMQVEPVDDANAFVEVGRAGAPDQPILLTTADAGLTWRTRTMPAAGTIAFSDPLTGWLAAGAPANALYRTIDGGKHWRPVSIALPPDADSAGVQPALPTFSDSVHGALPVTVQQGDRAEIALYTSSDGGSTWTLVSRTPTAVPILGTTVATSALGASDWLAAVDQGRRVVALPVATGGPAVTRGASPLTVRGGKGFVASYQRASSTLAWAVVRRCSSAAGCTAELARSSDAGATWQIVLTL